MGKSDRTYPLSSVTSLNGVFPFRLGATSYVIPADLAPNVCALAGLVDDVEVVLFQSEKFSNLPDSKVIETMAQVGAAHNMTYTIHLPLDIHMGAEDDVERQRSVEQCRRIIELTGSLDVFAYILHLPLHKNAGGTAENCAMWRARCCDSISKILGITGVSPIDICIENLSYPYENVYPVVEKLGLSVCFDIGHVLLNDYDLNDYYTRYFSRARVIHLHGLNQGKDHQSVKYFPESLLLALLQKITASDMERVLTMEVFGTDDFLSSMSVMKGMGPCTG